MTALSHRGFKGRIEGIAGEKTQEFWLASELRGGAVVVG